MKIGAPVWHFQWNPPYEDVSILYLWCTSRIAKHF